MELNSATPHFKKKIPEFSFKRYAFNWKMFSNKCFDFKLLIFERIIALKQTLNGQSKNYLNSCLISYLFLHDLLINIAQNKLKIFLWIPTLLRFFIT